jgi:hypothetical protein
MKEYKALRGFYGGTEEITIIVPENIKFLCRDGDIGHGLHNGHNHYMTFIHLSDYDYDICEELTNKNPWLETCEFGDDLLLLVFDNIKFIDNVPLYESYQEMMDEFELNQYYIIETKKDKFDTNIFQKLYGEDKSILNVDVKDLNKFIIKGKPFKISKINKIEGPYAATLFSIMNGNYYDDKPSYCMILHENVELISVIQTILNEYNITITKNAVALFEEMKNNVLNQIYN